MELPKSIHTDCVLSRKAVMGMREKLIEILRVPIYPHELVDPIEAVADYLIDSGVTIQQWIPVTERVP